MADAPIPLKNMYFIISRFLICVSLYFHLVPPFFFFFIVFHPFLFFILSYQLFFVFYSYHFGTPSYHHPPYPSSYLIFAFFYLVSVSNNLLVWYLFILQLNFHRVLGFKYTPPTPFQHASPPSPPLHPGRSPGKNLFSEEERVPCCPIHSGTL